MTVITLGFPGTQVDGVVNVDPGADFADTLEWIEAQGCPVGTLIVVRDRPEQSENAHRARLLRALAQRPDSAIATVVCPATRAELLRRLLAEWVRRLSPVELHALVGGLNASLRTVAVIGNVSELRRPAPSVPQHALGLLPGSTFAVDLDRGSVTSAKAGFTDFPLEASGPGTDSPPSVRLTYGQAQDWSRLLPGGDTEGVLLDETLVRTGDFWGAKRWAEVTAIAESPDSVVERVLATPGQSCPVCGREVRLSRSCPFCGVVTRRTEPTEDEVHVS